MAAYGFAQKAYVKQISLDGYNDSGIILANLMPPKTHILHP
jgi:hypothetical protein